MKLKDLFFYLIIVLVVAVTGCDETHVPRPRGYLRIELPKHEYQSLDSNCPFWFDMSKLAIAVPDTNSLAEPCWWYIFYPKLNAELYLTYKPVNNNFSRFAEDTRTLVYKHTQRANAINETLISNAYQASGILYEIAGDAASAYQFFVSDSSRHFLRGALYFNSVPNSDSLAPVIKYMKEDIEHMLATLQWK